MPEDINIHARRIARISTHSADLPPESKVPIDHYRHGANSARILSQYFEIKLVGAPGVYAGPLMRHVVNLRTLALFGLIGSFERFVKELAALCVDHLADLVVDDRLEVLHMQSKDMPAHFKEGSLGKALTEAGSWLNSEGINTRFKRLLADPSQKARFEFFPDSPTHPELPRRWRETLDILWQLRHSIAHNVGVITTSDAAKLRLLRRDRLVAPGVLAPGEYDIPHAHSFLDDLARINNRRVAKRLAEVLTILHANNPNLFIPAERATELATQIGEEVTVAGATGQP